MRFRVVCLLFTTSGEVVSVIPQRQKNGIMILTRKRHLVTVGELLAQLQGYPSDTHVYFGGLDFYRIKPRGHKVIQVEFNQSVYLDESDRVVVENHYPDDEPDVI